MPPEASPMCTEVRSNTSKPPCTGMTPEDDVPCMRKDQPVTRGNQVASAGKSIRTSTATTCSTMNCTMPE